MMAALSVRVSAICDLCGESVPRLVRGETQLTVGEG
jgi:hypothetical protein